MSGTVDVIVSGDRIARVKNGHPLMSRVTGMGCTATAITAAFAAVNASPFEAAVHAMVVMGIVGEIAAERAEGPGSFQVHFFDVLARLQESDLVLRTQVQGDDFVWGKS